MKLIDKIRDKLRRKTRRNAHDDDIINLPVMGPYDNMLPVPYAISEIFIDFEKNFETICRNFLKRTDLDKYNKGYMDALIDEMTGEAIELFDVQEVGHLDAINVITTDRDDAIKHAEIRVTQIPIEREKEEKEIAKLERIYYSGTAYEELVIQDNEMEVLNND